MPLVRKCAKCGLDITDVSATACPMCGTNFSDAKLQPSLGGKIWIGALVQFAVMTAFMLIFGFPKVMIVFFGIFILVGTVLSRVVRNRQFQPRAVQPVQLSRPILYRTLSVLIAVTSLAIFATLLFSTVIFLNAWSRYQTYAGQPYHRSDFIVTHTYFQRGSKGGVSAYASGTVDGQKEWMDLRPYLHFIPHDEGEVDESVPVGTSIPIYLFPKLKGQMRVEVYSDTPTAEIYHRSVQSVLKKAPLALLLTAGILFVLVLVRRSCVRENDSFSSLSNPQT